RADACVRHGTATRGVVVYRRTWRAECHRATQQQHRASRLLHAVHFEYRGCALCRELRAIVPLTLRSHMPIRRRTLLRRMGATAAATIAARWLTDGLIAGEPGRFPPDTAQGRRPIRLNRNENAYGASDKVIAGMRDAVSSATRYPDFAREDLQSRIAGLHGVTTEQVVLGCGSGEILRMAVDAFLESKKKVVVAQPTFELIGQYARRLGTEVVAIPLNKDYSHDLNAMRARSDATTGLVYICNPNNPTGTLTRRSD